MAMPPLNSLITYNPHAISADRRVDELVHILDETVFHHWPVIDSQRRVVGLLSQSDIVRGLEAFRSAKTSDFAADGPACQPPQVDQIMSTRVVTIEHDQNAATALSLMVENRIHSLPVVEDEQLVGIVTSTDFLREMSYGQIPPAREPIVKRMERSCESVDVDASLDEVAALFLAGEKFVAITHGDCTLAVVSRREVLTARSRETANQLLGDYCGGARSLRQLVRNVPSARPGTKLGQAAGMMAEQHLAALGVVNQAHRLLGVLSEDTVLDAMSVWLAGESPRARMATV